MIQRILIRELTEGQVFDQSIFTDTGQKLIGPGVALTERHLQALRRCGTSELIVAESLDELAEHGIVQNAGGFGARVGQKSTKNLLTRQGKVLVEAGETVEQHHLDAMQEAGNTFLGDKEEDDGITRRQLVTMADVLVEQLEQFVPNMTLQVKPAADQSWISPADSCLWPSLDQLEAERAEAVEKLRRVFAKIEAGVAVDSRVFDETLDGLMIRLSQHPSRFAQVALLCRRDGEYLPDHAYTVAALSMAIAARLKWSEEDVRMVGFAGLIFDLGMLLVPERIRVGACELTEVDRQRVNRHPVFALAMLESVPDVPRMVQLAAIQHHERENGSGYPFGKRKNHICDYARVIAVADTYAATTEPRHYRKPKLPYTAMEETLRHASVQIFWPVAVRALISAAGLFPVGSYVKLSSGDMARVLASHPEKVDRPLIQLIDAEGQNKDTPIDLATTPKDSLSVVRPIASPLD